MWAKLLASLLTINKAGAATLAGALVTLLVNFVDLTPDVQGAIQTLLTAFLVWLIPNIAKPKKKE